MLPDTSAKMLSDSSKARPDTKAGSTAFMFTFGGLGSFGMNGFPIESFSLSVAGEMLSASIFGGGGKWFFMDNLALRGMIGLTTQSKGNVDSAGKTTSAIYGFAGGVEKHFDAISSVSPYVGAQITFAHASLDNQKTVANQIKENKETASSFGIGPLIGFDWYFTSGLAIGGEFMLVYSSVSITDTNPDATGAPVAKDNPSTTQIIISSANVHLVVHF
jgi:hypothetical protein